MKSTHSDLALRKLFLNHPFLFDKFQNNFPFIKKPKVKSTLFTKINENMQEIIKMDLVKMKEEIAKKKYKTVKKIFCNSLFISHNPTFIEELFWRFLISAPHSFQNYFKKEPSPEHYKSMTEHGFIRNVKHYKRLTRKLHRTINMSGECTFYFQNLRDFLGNYSKKKRRRKTHVRISYCTTSL